MRGFPVVTMRSERLPVGGGFTVAFTFDAGRIESEWHPRLPGKNRRKLIPAYRRARDEFLRRVAQRAGISIMVAEI